MAECVGMCSWTEMRIQIQQQQEVAGVLAVVFVLFLFGVFCKWHKCIVCVEMLKQF